MQIVAEDGFNAVKDELQRALVIEVEGGGIAFVKEIENLTTQEITNLNDRSGFRTVAQWTAKASAGHWGHDHNRTIRFRALVEVLNEAGVWKLSGITIVSAKQLS
jgi:ribulose 1,5-bisphosphate carboxylase large subunit-like protein